MSLNLLGIGFSFGAKDMGLSAMQEKFAAGFTEIKAAMKTVEAAAAPTFDEVSARAQDYFSQMGPSATDAFQSTFDGISTEATKSFEVMADAGDKAFSPAKAKTWASGFVPMVKMFTKMEGQTLSFRRSFRTGVEDTLKQGSFFFKKKADDIHKSQRHIGSGFGEIQKIVGKLNDLLRVNRLAGFVGAVSLGMLSKIKSGIGSLLEDSGQLSTSLESMGVSAAKTSKQTAVNMGLTGAALKKVTSQAAGMSIGLNIGAETATASIVGWTKATKEMGAIGATSASDIAQMSEVFGINAKDMSLNLIRMRKELGLDEKQIGQVISSMTAMGQQTGDVSGAIGQLPELLGLLSSKAAIAGGDLSAVQIQEFASQTVSLSAGLGKMGFAADEARSMSMGLAKSIVNSQKEFQNMYAGTQTELPGLVSELAIAGGDIDFAFKQMSEGPSGFVKGLMHMAKSAQSQGADVGKVMEFMRARLEKAGIEGVDPLINFMKKADSATLATMSSVEKSTVSLVKLGKEGFSTGRTLQESFELAEQGFVENFRNISKGRQTFVTNTTKAFGEISKTMKTSTGGTKALLGTLADVHALGAKGLLPEFLQPYAHILGMIGKNMAPLIALTAGLTFAFGPLGAVAGGAATAFLILSKVGEKLKKTFASDVTADFAGRFGNPKDLAKQRDALLAEFKKDPWKTLINYWGERFAVAMKGLPKKLKKAFKGLDKHIDKMLAFTMEGSKFDMIMGSIWESLKESFGILWARFKEFALLFWGGLTSSLDPKQSAGATATGKLAIRIGEGLKSAFIRLKDYFFSTVWPVIKTFASSVWAGLTKEFDPATAKDDPAARIGGQIGTALRSAFDYVVGEIKTYLSGWWAKISTIWSDDSKTLKDKVSETFGSSGGLMAGAAAFGFLVGPDGVLTTVRLGLKALGLGFDVVGLAAKGIGAAFRVMDAVLKGLPVLMNLASLAATGLSKAFLFLAANPIVATIMAAVVAIGLIIYYWDDLKAVAIQAWEDIKFIWAEFEPTFSRWMGAVGDFFSGLWEGMKAGASAAWDWLKGAVLTLISVFDPVIKFYKFMWSLFVLVATTAWEAVTFAAYFWFRVMKTVFNFVAGLAKWLFGVIASAAKWAWENVIVPVWSAAVGFFSGLFSAIWGVVSYVVGLIGTALVAAWTYVIQPVWNGVTAFFSGVFNGVLLVATAIFNLISGVVVGAWNNIIKPVWAAVGGFFSTVFSEAKLAVESAINAIIGIFTGWKKTIDEVFGSIDKWVDDLFRNSISTDIAADMDEAVTVLKTMTDELAAHLRDSFAEAVVNGITTAFADGFKKTVKKTQEFIKKDLDLFKDFLKILLKRFKDTFVGIAEMSDLLTKNLADLVSQITLELSKAIAQFSKLQALKTAVAGDAAVATDAAETLELPGVPPEFQVMVKAIHMPNWWTKPGSGFKDIFRAEMQQLSAQLALVGAVMKSASSTQQPVKSVKQAIIQSGRKTSALIDADQMPGDTSRGTG
jgi:hypothetical protein